MTITRQHNGSLHITHIDDAGNYYSKVYYGYEWNEACDCFLQYLENEGISQEELQDEREGEFWEFVGFERHEYIDAEDDSGFVTCNEKGEII